jgi:hypothetical protein
VNTAEKGNKVGEEEKENWRREGERREKDTLGRR